MGLRTKFNLVLAVVFLVGLVATGFVSQMLLLQNAREEVIRDAELMMESALAIRAYTVDRIRPELQPLLVEKFLPETVPAFAATETLDKLKTKYPDYAYKEATLNPTNPRDRTTDWEADLVQTFRQFPDRKEIVGEREAPTGRVLYIARPIQVTNPACLECHSTPESAPASMVRIYGPGNGFGWMHNEIVGAQVVSVPMSLPIQNANRAFTTFMISMVAVFAFAFVVINVMLGWLIIRPISRMSRAADQISTGDFDVPEFPEQGRDEVARLSSSFNRMRRSLQKAMQMIEG